MTLTRLGIVRRSQGLTEEAAALHAEAIERLDEDPASTKVDLMDALNNLGNALDDCGDPRAAIQALGASIELGNELFGHGHPRVPHTVVNLAIAHLRNGDEAAAKRLLAESQGVQPDEISIELLDEEA